MIQGNFIYLQKIIYENHDSLIPFQGFDFKGEFFNVFKTINQPVPAPSQSNLLFQSEIDLVSQFTRYERTVYNLIQFLSDIGGGMHFLFVLFYVIVFPVGEH